ncbi:YjbH domain-containing protein [Billgrantia aerodenitrificans]|uniref:YjbH domain-containing protein n=1 Tax=Billgrantia aerodenitrificans TaxID=2733483 RepID=A0ABS9AST7_9GAMM|nr:YjbH domain-containing protein [Halomonas aerodenitrificans]MCE8024811.1 YjbH domain-containing protein [Halomonas aerodenitrificans]
MKRPTAHPLRLTSLVLAIMATTIPAAADSTQPRLGTGQGDFGGVGIMQTPTARMAPLGGFAFSMSRTAPYRRYSLFFQPTEWLEAGFRYVEVENRRYLAARGDRNNLDKGVDVKLRLREEDRYWPQIAVGARDIGGTGLFAGEYLVASKRWHDFDFTLGIGWGYLGNQEDFTNPLSRLDDSFERRSGFTSGGDGGSVNLGSLFSGRSALFGGIEYQTPWRPLVLQLELEGNDYQREPQRNHQEQDSRVNLGARLQLSDNVELKAGWQRGNTAMLGISVSTNLAGVSQLKRDPLPAEIGEPPAANTGDWSGLSSELDANAGIGVYRIYQSDNSVVIEGEPTRYPSLAESEYRAGRLLHNHLGNDVDTLRFRWHERGMPLRESVHDRHALAAAAVSSAETVAYRHGLYAHAGHAPSQGELLHETTSQGFSYSLAPQLEQNFGGPDGYLYRLSANFDSEYRLGRNDWLSATLTYTLDDNLDRYHYIGPSDLPRVRTHIGDYLAETDIGLSNLQYTRTAQLGNDWYAMGYGGLLETMFAGAGGELLYRPFNSDVALGLDVNWVKQREFDQRFGMRDYSTWTGHLTGYWQTDFEDVLAKVSVGRYLAGDLGVTFDFSREFESGIRLGGWATFTDAGSDFGEGSFDKGIYLSMPLDAFFVRSTRQRAQVAWRPLTRDGGAQLARRQTLFDLTEERSMGRYWEEHAELLR